VWPFNRKSAPAPETKAGTDTAWWPFTDWITPSASGIVPTADAAMRVPAFNAAVMLTSDPIRVLPCELRLRGEVSTVVTDHPAHPLVSGFANDWSSAGDVRQRITIDSLLYGDGFGFVSKVAGKPVEIIHLPRGTVSIEWMQTGEPVYSINGERYGPGEILHIAQPNWNGAPAQRGLGLLHNGRDAIALCIQLEQAAARLFKNNARPGGLLSFSGSLNKEAATRAAASWKAAHSGDGAGGVAVMDNAASFTPLSFTSVDAQHAEQRNFAVNEIARLTRVPAVMLSDLSRATWSNVESLNLQFLQTCLLPWLKRWTDAYALVLLTKEERSKYCFAFDVEDLLRADTATRTTAYSQLRSMGAVTANEVRAWEGLPPKEDGDVLQNPFTTSGKQPANDNTNPKENAA
jgi:HK97 family phage portal protein